MSTWAEVAKRGKCIVRTTGHYSDAENESELRVRLFFMFRKELLE